MPDQVNWQDLLPVGGKLSSRAYSIGAATATIAPKTFLTVMTAGVAVATITPPVEGVHMLALLFADATGVTNTGNIAVVAASVANRPMLLIYNPITALYYPVTVA